MGLSLIAEGITNFNFVVECVGNLMEEEDGIIEDYWVRVSFSIQNSFLFWKMDGRESFSFCELIWLRKALNNLLSDKYSEQQKLEFIEPDYRFHLYPKTDLRTIFKGWFKDPIRDIYMDFIINITYGRSGEPNERHIIPFYRNDIYAWRDYLDEVIEKFDYRGKQCEEYPYPED